jgi:hypothetical protein
MGFLFPHFLYQKFEKKNQTKKQKISQIYTRILFLGQVSLSKKWQIFTKEK